MVLAKAEIFPCVTCPTLTCNANATRDLGGERERVGQRASQAPLFLPTHWWRGSSASERACSRPGEAAKGLPSHCWQ
jgi:hypothetical protein